MSIESYKSEVQYLAIRQKMARLQLNNAEGHWSRLAFSRNFSRGPYLNDVYTERGEGFFADECIFINYQVYFPTAVGAITKYMTYTRSKVHHVIRGQIKYQTERDKTLGARGLSG